ncbi:uncharacterized protein TNIN_481711 [Trichonephila inaurata madagascariensis]|uniref:Uncharacterized protein n=1 Tax=Trichonephila inaurata madagascariensis TaxID=2747483 RepID=A0A8X6WRG8_9ARAC|nr:uncharacterized protein TNIN_481711 [Trichonephila inaurata madagascariensis]
MMAETNLDNITESAIETEDLLMTDEETGGNEEPGNIVPVNIDYNSRLISDVRLVNSDFNTYEKENNSSSFQSLSHDPSANITCEELELSDEELPLVNSLQKINLDEVSCFGVNKDLNSASSYNHSCTSFKEDCLTDAEFVSDDEGDTKVLNTLENKRDNKMRRLSGGLLIFDGTRTVKGDGFSSEKSTLCSSYIEKSFANSMLLKDNFLSKFSDRPSPLMTCFEFLKSEISDEEVTDVEDFSLGSDDGKQCIERPVHNLFEISGDSSEYKGKKVLEDTFRYRGNEHSSFNTQSSDRKPSWTVELLSEDDTGIENDETAIEQNLLYKRNTKRHSNSEEFANECLTDEEVIDLNNKEWTETDDSGCVRQVTVVKTETSINFEGDDAVKSLRKVPEKEASDTERKGSTDSEQDDLSFTEKKSYFQRLSLTADTLPSTDKWTQDVSLDDLPMAEGEIVQEQISFEDKLKMFEPDEGNRKKIQKREKTEQPTVYRYDFTKSTKERPVATEFVVSELEKAEEIVKQVNEELCAEESRLNDSIFDINDRDNVESELNSAITLEKVEQEVYSLLAEVDKEEKELSKDYNSGMPDSDLMSPIVSLGMDKIERDENAESEMEKDESTVLNLEHSEMGESISSERIVTEETYAQELEVEENVKPAQAHPVEEPTISFEALASRDLEHIKGTYSDYEEETYRKLSVELCRKDELHEAIKLDEDDSISVGLESEARPSNLSAISSVLDSHIKSEILQEEIDQSIEESPLEVKQIVDDLQKISESEDHKCNVYKHIRTEIFSQELGADIESGSPERKELGAFSLKKSDSLSDVAGEKLQEQENSVASDFEIKDTLSDVSLHELRKTMSPQVSEESCGHTDDISSEGVVVEPDEHLVDYDEARDEHSLTEQLQALASNSKALINEPLQSLDFGSHEFDHLTSGMSSSISDLEVHRRAKDIAYARHEKKEIRSLKSTKQVSTIEEHSSIESCDSPQELALHDLPEKNDVKSKSDDDDDDDHDESDKGGSAIKTDIVVKEDGLKMLTEDSENRLSPEEKLYDFPVGSDLDSNLLPRQSDSASETSKMSRSDSKSSHSKKSDSDAEGSKIDSAGESSGKRKEESCSSSGESPYYSVETSDSGRTPRSTPAASRPCSSEFDINVFSGHGSEYETCVTSQEASGEASGSYATAVSSQEISYATACSSFSHSSRESAYSVDSESSGHLASVEVSSEASETLVPSAQEMELEFGPDLEMPVLDEEPANDEDDDLVREPYDMDIPEAIIRGGIEIPFMKNWDMNNPVEEEKMKQLPQQWMWQFATESEVSDKFEVLGNDDFIEDSKPSNAFVSDTQPESTCANKVKSEDTKQYLSQVGTSSSHSVPSHRRSASSVVDIIPDKERLEPTVSTLDEEPLSVSESSATHSEQTWQTSSIDTAVQLSSHAPASSLSNDASNVMLDSFQETPPEKELTSELGYSSNLESSYLQLNGPIEVDYIPDYDNPDGGSELTSNQIQSSNAYEVEGLQFDLEMEGASAAINTGEDSDANIHVGTEDGPFEHENNEDVVIDDQSAQLSADYESPNNVDADKPEAQQQQSMGFINYEHQESESLVCSDLTSYLPESDQCELLPEGESLPPSFESEINIPCAESISSSEGLPNLETRSNLLSDLASTDSLEKGDTVDTSPEDERYEYKSMKPSAKSPKEETSREFSSISPTAKCHESDILNPESDYASQHFTSKYDEVPGTDLYTHQEEEEFDIRETYLSPIPSVEEDKQSTPSSEAFHGRRFFPRSGDTSAASSLQEFERLEAEISAGRISRSSIDSSERVVLTKSGEHDDVSMSSLTEFEKLEKECTEPIQDSNKPAGEDIMMLSEIEEGLESQCSDVIEILQESLHEGSDSEYERRRIDIEEVIKVAQCNVEKFQEETVSEGATSDECTVLLRVLSETQDSSETTKVSSREDGNTDFEESEHLALTLENDSTTGGHDSSSSGEKNCGNEKLDCMVSSTDSMDPSSSTATHATYQFETDSVMSSSLNSAQASGEECTMVSSTDTLEPEPKITYSHGDSTEDKMHLSSRTEESMAHSSKGALECKLKELQSTNGAKQQMEMFLSKLTDESVLMDDFTSHSFPDVLDDSEQQSAPDDFLQSIEAAQGVSSSGDGTALDGDDLVSTTTTTTTTRVVTSVISDPDVQSEVESSFVQQLSGDDIRQSCEITFSDTVHGDSTVHDDSGHNE